AGLTAAAAVQTLRDEGFDGRLLVVGEEPHVPYERPPLSKEFLRGEQERASLEIHPEGWFEERAVEMLLGVRATAIDPGATRLTLSSGEDVRYDALLIATGGRPRTLVPPSERVVYLRTIEDADRLRWRLGADRHVLVVGAGFIGSEVAASARDLGSDVTLLDVFDVPLQRALGSQVGSVMARVHEERGVTLRMGDAVASIEERDDAVAVRTDSGRVVEGDVAVVGVSIVPNTELAEAAGIRVANGVVVDERCRTSEPRVFAAGDVANHFHPLFGRQVRVEHFDNALKHGGAAARNMLGVGEAFADPHWFWSDQYDVNLQFAGDAEGADDLVLRGALEDRDGIGFYLRDGVVVACVALNRGRDVRRAMKLIASRARPDVAALGDEDVDLRSLVSSR
ncbi:MAG TPA: FAD-dependent oxidoreductase, partial [Actinomycetota bacterium]|nr:FAD-dependent oxidoreductase [Actinomycetota bacterium]